MHRLHTLLALLLICILFQMVSCLRISKENTRPRAKCLSNLTSNHETQSSSPRCIALNHPYCLDLKLTYNSTILLEPTSDLNFRSFQEVTEYLEQWRGVQKYPGCWPVLQVALCSLLMPQCEESNPLQVHKPSVDICNDLTRDENCKFVERTLKGWPSIFNCSDNRIYLRNCSSDLREHHVAFPSQKPTCQYPLVPSGEDKNFFRDIDGCALHCKYPVLDPDERARMDSIIRFLCLFGLASTIAALMLDLIRGTDSVRSRLENVIKGCTACQLLFYTGWSLQVFLAQDVGCNSDGSALHDQPLVANPCVLSFLLTYMPALSSLLWCVHLGKLFHEMLDGGTRRPKDNTKFDETIIYGVPIALLVSVLFLGQIDGHGLYGICTVGQRSQVMQVIFVFIPTLVGTLWGNYYFIRIILMIAFSNNTEKDRIHKRDFIRISALSALTLMQITLVVANYYYEHHNKDHWLQSIENFLACKLNLNELDSSPLKEAPYHQNNCRIAVRPIVSLYYLELLSTLGIGLVISSWAFSESNFRALRRKLIDLLEDENERRRRTVTDRLNNTLLGQSAGPENGQIIHEMCANPSLASTDLRHFDHEEQASEIVPHHQIGPLGLETLALAQMHLSHNLPPLSASMRMMLARQYQDQGSTSSGYNPNFGHGLSSNAAAPVRDDANESRSQSLNGLNVIGSEAPLVSDKVNGNSRQSNVPNGGDVRASQKWVFTETR